MDDTREVAGLSGRGVGPRLPAPALPAGPAGRGVRGDAPAHTEERLRFLLGAVPDAMLIADAHGRIVSVNHEVEVLFGHAAGDLVGQPVEVLLPARLREGHAQHQRTFLADLAPRTMSGDRDLIGLHRDGSELPVEVRLRRLRGPGAPLVVASIRDIRGRKQSEAQLRRRGDELERRVQERTRELSAVNQTLRTQIAERREIEERLLHAQKLDALGHLTGGVAHDFNNLLTIIGGNLQVLRMLVGEAPQLLKLIDGARRGVERGTELARKLLTFGRRQPLHPRPTDLSELINNMTDMLRRTLGPAIRLETAFAPGLPAVQADPGQLENALLNLSLNSRDAMPRGGTLSLSAGEVSADRARADGAVDLPGEALVAIRVRDTGVGMTAETLQRACEPFYTTKPPGQGTGLGLAAVYGFARQSGGDLQIQSQLGVGTTVVLYLPQAKSPPRPVAPRPASQPGLSTARETLLLVEDDDEVRQIVSALVADLGYQVLQASDGESALQVLQGPRGIDLLLTDFLMPGALNGLALAREARRLRPSLRIVLMSGYLGEALAEDVLMFNRLELLPKPFDREDLDEALRRSARQTAARRSPDGGCT